jgi:hypothetical protein
MKIIFKCRVFVLDHLHRHPPPPPKSSAAQTKRIALAHKVPTYTVP